MTLDILSVLRSNNGRLNNVIIYGRVVAKLSRPTNLYNSCMEEKGGTFAKMNVFAIDLSNHKTMLKERGIESEDNVYMLPADSSICVFVPLQGNKYPDYYALEGNLIIGSKTLGTSYCSMFNFKRNGDKWIIECGKLKDISIAWTIGTEHFNFICNLDPSKDIVYSETAKGYQPMKCREEGYHLEVKEQTPVTNTPHIEPTVITNPTTTVRKGNRAEVKPYSNTVKSLQSLLADSDYNKDMFITSLKSDYAVYNSSYVEKLVTNLKYHMKKKSGVYSNTGRSILIQYLSDFAGAKEIYSGKRRICDVIIDHFDDAIDYMLYGNEFPIRSKAVQRILSSAFRDVQTFYAGVVSKILGINAEMLYTIEEICTSNGISFSNLINKNPYAMQTIYNISFKDIEYIAVCFGKADDMSLNKYRNISILNSYINSNENSSTIFDKSKLLNQAIGLTLTEAAFAKVSANGNHLSNTVTADIKTFLGITPSTYDVNSFNQKGRGYIKRITQTELQVAVKDYLASGLGVEYDNKITSSFYLQKELYVYNKIYTIGKEKTGFSETDIEKYISEYERKVGFKLEKEQHDSVMLIKNKAGVITGSAGSGKTTVSNCLVYVLSKLDPDVEFKFAAPTGRAAKRMQEVVKQPVKTMSSMFRVGISDNTSGIFEYEDNTITEPGVAYFFDECAMVSIDLMYSVMKGVSESSYCYLFGDFNQLPPIGKGIPFKNMLDFMPSQILGVSKRAALGSRITANSDRINNYSTSANWQNLESGNDFCIIPCADDKIAENIVILCKHFLGEKLSPSEYNTFKTFKDIPQIKNFVADDIQIVTPISKANYIWGSTYLNKLLEPIFNKNRGYDNSFVYCKGDYQYKFTIGDRVVHKDVNKYTMQWYGSYENGEFTKIYGNGICNGEVGTVVGFYPADTCVFYDEEGECPPDFEYIDNLRDDTTYKGEDAFFVVVKYYDYMDSRDFYILYRASTSDKPSNLGIALTGDDLSMLDLFYAGTTHKLQGSQAKLIIAPLGNVNFKGFITRNMMYTVYTRAQEAVITLGSVGNEQNSMLSSARRDVAGSDILTVGQIL